MGTITAAQIIDEAVSTLQDPAAVTWPRAELFAYVNDGQRDACIVKPDAYVLNQTLVLVAGTRQLLPAAGAAFIRLVRNMGQDGQTPGRAPRAMAIETLDRENPNWHSDVSNPVVLEYAFDLREPKAFYVSPPQPLTGRGQVDVTFCAIPPDLGAESTPIILDDIYKTALVHYVLYRAYLKEGELQNNADAIAHRAEFLALLGTKDESEAKAQGAA